MCFDDCAQWCAAVNQRVHFLPSSSMNQSKWNQCRSYVVSVFKTITSQWIKGCVLARTLLQLLGTNFYTCWPITTYLLYSYVPMLSSTTVSIFTPDKQDHMVLVYWCSLTCWLNFVFPFYLCLGCMLCSRSGVGCFPLVLCPWILHRR